MDGALKTLKEVFKDFYSNNKDLLSSTVKSVNLFKKTNTLEVELKVNTQIKIKDVYNFEKYLETRFGIKEACIKLVYEENNEKNEEGVCETNTQKENISEEWLDIIEYMAIRHPMTKAILNNSNITIDQNQANVMLSMKGREFLTAKKIDETLSNLLFNIYGKKLKVNFIENISEEQIRMQQEYAKKQEEELIKHMQEEIKHVEENSQEQNKPLKENVEHTEVAGEEFFGGDVPVPDEAYLSELEEMEEENNIILGTASKAKECKVKIKDIEASNKRITIEGRVVECTARETKTGKGMLIYDIYDGTGIITCKSFTKNIEEGNEVANKIKNASGIKTIGKAGLDSFAGDVTIMAMNLNEVAEID